MSRFLTLILLSIIFSCKRNIHSDPKFSIEDSNQSIISEDSFPSKMEKLFLCQEYDSMIIEFKKNKRDIELYSIALILKNQLHDYELLMKESIRKLVIDSTLRNIGPDFPIKRDSFEYFYDVKLNSNVSCYEALSLAEYTGLKYNGNVKNNILIAKAIVENPTNEIIKFKAFSLLNLNDEVTYPESGIDYINRLIKLFPYWSELYDVKLDLIIDRLPRIELADNKSNRQEILKCLTTLVSQNYYEKNCNGSASRTLEIKNLITNFDKTDIIKINQIVNYSSNSNKRGVDYKFDNECLLKNQTKEKLNLKNTK